MGVWAPGDYKAFASRVRNQEKTKGMRRYQDESGIACKVLISDTPFLTLFLISMSAFPDSGRSVSRKSQHWTVFQGEADTRPGCMSAFTGNGHSKRLKTILVGGTSSTGDDHAPWRQVHLP